MAITVPVNLTPAEEAALAARAHAEGVSVESLLREAILHLISAGQSEGLVPLAADQWETELVEWLDSMPDLPSLSDEAIGESAFAQRASSLDGTDRVRTQFWHSEKAGAWA
jgi:hypothetical protein